MVDQPDETGGYLLNRIKKVQEIIDSNDDIFWTNQYENENNYKSYKGLAEEIGNTLPELDYLFVAVSSCGTIVGLSSYLRERYPELRIIGVDIEGSMIFNDKPSKRRISGLGSSKKPHFSLEGVVDDHVCVKHVEIVSGCNQLLRDHAVFAGGSSGACYFAAKNYMKTNGIIRNSAKALIIVPDSGESYVDTIYNDEWLSKL
jgi:cysteine synthase A